MTRLDESDEIYVEIIDFGDCPGSELVTQNADGSYTVLVNARIAYEQQQESIRHAMEHIADLDFEKDNVQEIEAKTHHTERINRNEKKSRNNSTGSVRHASPCFGARS